MANSAVGVTVGVVKAWRRRARGGGASRRSRCLLQEAQGSRLLPCRGHGGVVQLLRTLAADAQPLAHACKVQLRLLNAAGPAIQPVAQAQHVGVPARRQARQQLLHRLARRLAGGLVLQGSWKWQNAGKSSDRQVNRAGRQAYVHLPLPV